MDYDLSYDNDLSDLRTEARMERRARNWVCGVCRMKGGGHFQGCPEAMEYDGEKEDQHAN